MESAVLHCAIHHSMHGAVTDASQGVTNTLRTRRDLLQGQDSCMNANLQAQTSQATLLPVAGKCKAGTFLLNISANVYCRQFTFGRQYE